MEVKAIFSDNYVGELAGAVWILETEQNRLRFLGATDLDESSALFSIVKNASMAIRLREIIWGIQDHYSDVTAISVIGLNYSIARILADECETEPTNEGFDCRFLKR